MRNGQCGTVTIATKINRQSKAMLDAIAEKAGLKVYNLLQTVIDAYLRYCSNGQAITPHLENLINGFADFQVTKDSFALCAPDNAHKAKSVRKCIAFVEQAGKPQARPVLLYSKTDAKGNAHTFETMADDAILQTFLLAFAPKLVADLREIRSANNLLSLADALKFAIREQTEPTKYDITADIESLFADNNRDENGRVIDYEDSAQQYVRHNNKSVSAIA